jgi:hypothetical protein
MPVSQFRARPQSCIPSPKAPVIDRAGQFRFNRGPLNQWDLCLLDERQQWDQMVSNPMTRPLPYCPKPSDRYHQVLPPWLDMPPEAKHFQRFGTLPVFGNTTGTDTALLLQPNNVVAPLFVCDTGYDGIITDLVLGIIPPAGGGTGFTNASGEIVWRVGVDFGQAPNLALYYFRDYGNVIVSIGSLEAPTPVAASGGLRFISGQAITIYVNMPTPSTLNNAATIVGVIGGYTYPR